MVDEDISITDEGTLEPTREEHAYHVGWSAYFEMVKNGDEYAVSPYDSVTEKELYFKWKSGFDMAKRSDD